MNNEYDVLEKFEECTHNPLFRVYKDRENNGDVTYIGVCTRCGFYTELRDRKSMVDGYAR